MAGTGKTTIAQTIAERTFADGHLGASFFCSRDSEDRSNLHFIFPALAVQLARKCADFRSLFIVLAQINFTDVSYDSLYDQMDIFIIRPLRESNKPTVIIIDALDECKDEEPVSSILSVLARFISAMPNVKILVTGRPEPHILEGFRLPLLAEATDVFVLHNVDSNQVDNDIRLFFRHQFSELAHRRHALDAQPMEEQLDLICKRAGGLFAYAVETIKLIDKENSHPGKELDLLLQSPRQKQAVHDIHNGKPLFITHADPGSSIHVDSAPAWTRLVSQADLLPHEVISLIEAIFKSEDEIKMIRGLHGDDAQTFIDTIYRVCFTFFPSRSTI